MSLFPAYKPSTSREENEDLSTITKVSSEGINKIPDLSWLHNSSYISVSNNQDVKTNQNKGESLSLSCDKAPILTSTHKKKKKKHKKEKRSRHEGKLESQKSTALKIFETDSFYEDKKQEKGNFLVSTLHRPAIPKYSKESRYFKEYKLKKYKDSKRKVKRYFILTSRKKDVEEVYDNDQSVKEEELTRVTEDFNKRLATNPSDVDVWLEYVKFQDTIYDFEKAYRKNPVGGVKVTNERKLAILERALQSNPVSEQLLQQKLALCEQFWPADRLASECTKALTQEPGNLVLWRALIHTTQNSMARCTVPGVQQLYSKAISRINQLRLHRPALSVEQDILGLVLECGMFLQQAGLWEQLWTLLQMYLSLSLTATGQFELPFTTEDDKLREQEDSIVASGLPLSELWLRVEQLRAAAHFLPDPNCDSDPQRVVFTDDMAGLVQPVMSPELRLPLVVTTAVLLKVPLLPSRHCILSTIGLLHSPSIVGNIEALLPAVTFNDNCCRWLQGALELLSEPQYIRSERYLDWVLKLLQYCADLLSPSESVLIHCCILRLYGMLCRLLSLRLTNVPPSLPKQARSHAKQLLKSPQHRENLILFTEYALMERDSGDVAKACKVLETAAAMAPQVSEPNVDYIYLCRKLVECLLQKNPNTEKDHAVKVLIALGDNQPLISTVTTSDVSIKRSLNRWHQQTANLVDRYLPRAKDPLPKSKVAEAMSPQLLVEWLSCHAILLSLTTSVWEATALLQRHIDMIPHIPGTLGWLWVEQLYESSSSILYSHCIQTATGFAVLRDTLVAALATFPNNICLLGTLASIETSGGGGGGSPLWKLVSYFPSSSPLARLVLVFVVRYRVSHYYTEDEAMGKGSSPYLGSLLGRLTEHPVTGRCPLVWRLYLQLVAASGTATRIKEAFYKCVNTCPWVKSFYVDAVKFLPEQMSEILDLMIEKELRLHTTPEELDILRD